MTCPPPPQVQTTTTPIPVSLPAAREGYSWHFWMCVCMAILGVMAVLHEANPLEAMGKYQVDRQDSATLVRYPVRDVGVDGTCAV